MAKGDKKYKKIMDQCSKPIEMMAEKGMLPVLFICQEVNVSGLDLHGNGTFAVCGKGEISIQKRIKILEAILEQDKEILKGLN